MNSRLQVAEHSQIGCRSNLDRHTTESTIRRLEKDDPQQERGVHYGELLHPRKPNESAPEAFAEDMDALGRQVADENKGFQNGAGSEQVLLEILVARGGPDQAELAEVGKAARDAGKVVGEHQEGQVKLL